MPVKMAIEINVNNKQLLSGLRKRGLEEKEKKL
jgi:hypothetical protein